VQKCAAPSGTSLSEDGLVLNVWRPAEASADPLPVMVWIPGGFYVGAHRSKDDITVGRRRGIPLTEGKPPILPIVLIPEP
jgi:carboxylesterase type B